MRWRLLLAFLAVILVTLLSLSFWIQNNTVDVVDNFFRKGGNYGAEALVDELERHYETHGDWQLAEDILLSNNKRPGQGMMNTGGQTQPDLAHMGDLLNRLTMSLADKNGFILYGLQIGDSTGKIDDEILNNSIKLYHIDKIVGYLIPSDIRIYNDLNYSDSLGEKIRIAAFNSILIAGAVSVLLAFILGYFLLIPIRQLTGAAEDLAKGDFSTKLTMTGAKEFVTLGKTFTYLAESLQSNEKRRQAMTADIAHELRTPLAVQRANLEAMQDGIYPINQENINLLLEQNEMLNQMVEDLRVLALTDANELSLVLETVDFNQLILTTVELFKSQAEKKEIALNFQSDEEFFIEGDPARLSQILNNLLSNGLRHSPENGLINLKLNKIGQSVQLDIYDNGPGIPEDVLPYIFDRFYRADSSRARDQGGSGLGLTIAKRLAEAMGGKLVASNHAEGGAKLSLTLPIKI